MHVLQSVPHVHLIVDSNVVHVPPNVQLDFQLIVVLHVRKGASTVVTITATSIVRMYVEDVPTCVILASVDVLESVQ